jgi:hypothetical protein
VVPAAGGGAAPGNEQIGIVRGASAAGAAAAAAAAAGASAGDSGVAGAADVRETGACGGGDEDGPPHATARAEASAARASVWVRSSWNRRGFIWSSGQGIGTLVGTTSAMAAIPPMKMLLVVSSRSACECHMKEIPPTGFPPR